MWSTAAAALIHIAIFAFGPSWQVARVGLERQELELQPLVALPALQDGPLAGGEPLPLVPSTETEDDEVDEAGVLAGEDGAAIASLDVWDAVTERLKRGGGVIPSLADRDPESEVDDDGELVAQDDSVERFGGDALTAEQVDLPEPDSLDLDRLSALRPELALVTASAWVLIRNPTEVETFLRRGYRQGTLDPAASGSVNVTLWIDQRGAVQWAEVSKSSGDQDLDEYALAVFNEVALFKAAREDGVSVSRSVTLSLNFPW